MRKRSSQKPRATSYPPCDNPSYAAGRAKIEAGTTTLGNVAIKFQAMIGGASKAAYSRTYVGEYKSAWEKDWPYLCEMLNIIEKEEIYSEFWMNDGVPQPTYETFTEYCEAEVEPFVGPIASLRERYLELKDGKIDVESGAQQQKAALTLATCRRVFQELQAEGKGIGRGIKTAVAVRSGVTHQYVSQIWDKIASEMSTDDTLLAKQTKLQTAIDTGISRNQLHRIETVAKHPDLEKRTKLPKSDPQHLSIGKAYLGASLREGRRPDPVEPIRRAMMKLDQADRRRAVEWVISWAKENGDVNDAS